MNGSTDITQNLPMRLQMLGQKFTSELNNTKELLNIPNYEDLKYNSPFESKVRQIRKGISKSSNGQFVTKAWLKMWEMLTTTPLGNDLSKRRTLRAFFNAELPGAFIFATNHYLKTQGKNMDWVISSYSPETKSGDFLDDIFGVIKANPQRSLIGRTTSSDMWVDGDLTNPDMPVLLSRRAGVGSIDLYTADGGFDFSGREDKQEEVSLPLIKGEIETGLRSVKIGGAMVLKIFTFFTREMQAWLLLLMRSFQQYLIFKPSTSGSLNSETYFIGIGYLGPTYLPDLFQPPEQILETITSTEFEYLTSRMTDLTVTQIQNIKRFLNGQATTMPVPPYVPRLHPKDKIRTIK